MFFNLLICIVALAMTQDEPERSHGAKVQDLLREHASYDSVRRYLRSIACKLCIASLSQDGRARALRQRTVTGRNIDG